MAFAYFSQVRREVGRRPECGTRQRWNDQNEGLVQPKVEKRCSEAFARQNFPRLGLQCVQESSRSKLLGDLNKGITINQLGQ
jgi:hypothetical protein